MNNDLIIHAHAQSLREYLEKARARQGGPESVSDDVFDRMESTVEELNVAEEELRAAKSSIEDKLGQGDFSTSIPVGGTQEVGKLSRTIEDMRNNLIELTGALRRREARRARRVRRDRHR